MANILQNYSPWLLFGVMMLFMMRKGGCCGGHGAHEGHGSHNGHEGQDDNDNRPNAGSNDKGSGKDKEGSVNRSCH